MIKLRKKQKGFTLVELLIVIAIIAVLAAVVTPVALGAINDSKATAIYAEVKAIETAQLTKYVQAGSYTTDFEDLDLSGVSAEGKSSNAQYGLVGTSGDVLKIQITTVPAGAVDNLEALLEQSESDKFEITINGGSEG